VTTNEPPTDEWTKTVCKIGQGHDCCRYLTMSPDGWSCEKHGTLARLLDRRAAAGEMVARSDNCPGKGSR
jgi:hypothetical protein